MRDVPTGSALAEAVLGGVHRLEECLSSLMSFGPSEEGRARLASIIADLDRLCLKSPEIGMTFQEYCRHEQSLPRAGALPEHEVMVLIAQAAPDGLIGLRQARELSMIEAGLGSSDVARFRLHYCHGARSADLRRAIRKHSPTVFHFSGHGSSDGSLILHSEEEEDAVAQAVSELVDVFAEAPTGLRLAFLNACWTEPQALALCTVSACAIGIRGRWSDSSAVVFAQKFYEELAAGRSVEASFNDARDAVAAASASDAALPELRSAYGVDPGTVHVWNTRNHG